MINSRKYIEDEDPIIQLRYIRDSNARKYKTTKELLDYLDKTLSPEDFLAKPERRLASETEKKTSKRSISTCSKDMANT
jgi:hypothetical protein